MPHRLKTARGGFTLLAAMTGHRLLGMVGGILDALLNRRLVILPRLGEFLDGLLGRVGRLQQVLRLASLFAAVCSALAPLVARLVRAGFAV
jgi:hypothetical protein